MEFESTEVSWESIEVSDRAREDMKDINPLVESIKTKGLLNPLTIVKNPKGSKLPYRLLAGGRRFVAAQVAGLEKAPVRIYQDNLDPLMMKCIELEENIQREDLSYLERCNLEAEITNLRVKIHGEKSTSPDSSGWSQKDTADLVGLSKMSISQDLEVAKFAELLPELNWQAMNRKDALKMAKRIKEQTIVGELAERTEQDKGSLDEERKKLLESYVLGDFFEMVKKLPDKSMHFVEIDPPYAIDLKEMKGKDPNMKFTYGETYNEIDQNEYENFMPNVFEKCYRVMADDSWILVWFAPDPWFAAIFAWLEFAGFKGKMIPGFWPKPQGQCRRPEVNLASSCEMFFYARKGNAQLAKQGRSNVFLYPPVAPQHKVHPTERPIPMMEDLCKTFSFQGSRILVPFAGSGNTLIAARNMGMNAIGYDVSKEFRDSYVAKVANLRGGGKIEKEEEGENPNSSET